MAEDAVDADVDVAADEAAPNGGSSRSLADKVDHLFRTVRSSRGEYTYEQVASEIRDAGGPTISAAYVWMLRNGKRDNPTMKHLEALASFFGVPAAYFFDDEVSRAVNEQLSLVAAMRDAGVRKIAMRASGLSSESLGTIVDMIERVRALEGLPEGADGSDAGDAASDGARRGHTPD
ncbi:helix-turn-helix domain-containing protein [Quadrisphaera oryzae]|uniref:helix-turn-helix domain-containing protein n=1 Tax=Quadrisphaera TaxID=317661 RepID=UPI001C976793|nr:helix-turn-helix domain-containing protein [Quadrisphaera sp. RL12-1S]